MYGLRQHLLTAPIMFALCFLLPTFSHADGVLISNTLDRDDDAVIVTGEHFPDFNGVSLDSLFVYVYRDNQWQQIPWQFDEVDDNGLYKAADNGELDSADELVVMSMDCGDRVTDDNWINDTEAQSNKRYEITVIDPLDPEKRGWIYMYRSSSMTDTVTLDYVAFDYDTSVFTTPVYRLTFLLQYLGGCGLELNGSGINVLDRSKFKFKDSNQSQFDEEFVEFDEPQPAIIDGRIRAIAGYQEDGQGILTYAYRSSFYDLVRIDFSWAPGSFEWVRASADFNENVAGATYYDANTPSGVLVDGVPDSIATTPASLWQQVSASTGTVIHTVDVAPMGGTTSTYYCDNAQIDPLDTGDKVSYGDMGLTVTNPINYVYLAVTHYILPADQPNVGARYYEYFSHPLEVQTRSTALGSSVSEEEPRAFFLHNNYPNPFNPVTTMRYEAGEPARVEIVVYDLLGQKIRTLVDEMTEPGMHEVQWDGLNQNGQPVTSGMYLCVLKTAGFEMARKLLLLR